MKQAQQWIYLILISCFWQCSPPTNIGADFFADESFIVEEQDALDVILSTFALDSITSTESERLLVGRHADPVFGLVSSQAYVQFLLDDVLRLDNERIFKFDSLTLNLAYDGYHFYDTLQEVQLTIHRLNEELEPRDDESDFFTTDEFDFAVDPIARYHFRPRPNKGEDVEIRLDDLLGESFFQLLQEEADELLIESDFLDFFPGLVLRVENENGAFLGFQSLTAQMRLYLTDISELPLEQEIRTYSAEIGLNFNQIVTQRSGTALAEVNEEEGLSSFTTGHQSFIQAGSGVFTRVDIPDVRSLRSDNNDIVVAQAKLRFRAVDANFNSQVDLPPQIDVFWVDEDNTLFSQNMAARLVLDEEFGRDTYYEVDITEFIQFQLAAETSEDNGLVLRLGTTGNAIDRLVLGDNEHPDQMELRLFILDLKE